MTGRRIPLWVKVAYFVFLAVWTPVYWAYLGPVNFLWLCDVANFLIGLALWLEMPVLLSSQAVSVLLIQVLWIVDFMTRLLFGFHPIGGTAYMFDPKEAVATRVLSLFHVVMPVLLLWSLRRLGYDRRGLPLQLAIAWVVLPVSYLVAAPEANVNWLWRPFDQEQTVLSPAVYFAFAMAAYPLVLYLPTHLVLKRWPGPAQRGL